MIGTLIGGMMVALITGVLAGMEIQQLSDKTEKRKGAKSWN